VTGEDGLSIDRIRADHAESSALVRRTPVLSVRSLSERCGGKVSIKAESLQRTGSFKLRGALCKLRSLGDGAGAGVVAGSAGNHAQSLAYAARHAGVPCEVFMPLDAPLSKVEAVRAFGAKIHHEGSTVDECAAFAREHAEARGMTFCHPFDDVDVIRGQAGLGVELAEDVDDLARVVVPIGGGGLASGIAVALAALRPEVEVVGVQARACAPFAAAVAGDEAPPPAPKATIADGIAVKRPGEITLPLIKRYVADVVTVTEDEIATALVFLLERGKLVVEGAGAASLAALLSGAVTPAEKGTTVAVLSGGNVDASMLAEIAAHEETRAGRRLRLFTRVTDRPGGLAALLAAVADTRANLLTVDHVRDGVDLGVRQTGIELTLETRGRDHADAVIEHLTRTGYDVVPLAPPTRPADGAAEASARGGTVPSIDQRTSSTG
jgi:threonine dehydratase